MDRTVQFGWDPIFMAAGAMTGLRISVSIMLGGTLCWAVYVPILQYHDVIPPGTVGYTRPREMDPMGRRGLHGHFRPVLFRHAMAKHVASLSQSGQSLFSRRESRPERGRGRHQGTHGGHRNADFLVHQRATRVAGRPGVSGAWYTFEMPYWQSAIAVPFAFLLSLVACRVTGETDTTPIGAMGQVTQFFFGAVNPGSADLTLMSANITAAAAGSSADLLTDLKSGYLLGAHPAQTISRPVRRHFHGNAGDGALFSSVGAGRFRAGFGAGSRPRRADLEGGRPGAQRRGQVAWRR